MNVQLTPDSDERSGVVADKVMRAVSEELRLLANRHRELERVISLIVQGERLGPDKLMSMQDADNIAQHLLELGKFLANFTDVQASNDHARVELAVADVTLCALADRLGQQCLDQAPPHIASQAIEFF